MSITFTRATSISSSSGGPTLSGNVADVGSSAITIDQSFGASIVNQALPLTLTVANLQSLFLVSDRGCTIKTNGTATNEAQTITVTGTPTGGSFALSFKGAVTTPIAYNGSASDVQTALQGLSTIGAGNVTCTGGPFPGTAVVCTFAGTLASTNTPQITAGGGLTGGTSPVATVTTTTAGKPSDVIVLQPGIPLAWSLSGSINPSPFTVDVTTLYVSTTVACRLRGLFLTN